MKKLQHRSFKNLRADLSAGLTTALVTIPDAMASAILAGLSPIHGLYAVMVGTPIAALLSSSHFMYVATTGALAVGTGNALAGFEGEQKIQAMVVLVLLVGLIQLGIGLLRLSGLLRFVANAVLIGFMSGIAVRIILSQLGELTGYHSKADNAVLRALDLLVHLDRIDLVTTLLGLGTLAAVFLIQRTRLKPLSMVIAVLGATLLVAVAGLGSVPLVRDIANIPSGFPAAVLAMGPNAGQWPMRLYGRAALSEEERGNKGTQNGYGFDLHAGVRASAADKKARERLCGYLLRPPLSKDRLTRTTDGKFRVALKRVWDDGTAAIVLSGEELLARLAVLVPPPRVHTVRYFGLFAPRAKWRRLIVPSSPPASGTTAPEGHDHHTCEHGNRYRLTWAQALSKVFAVDATRCPRCGQNGLQQVAVIQDAHVLRAMLSCIARKAEPP